MKNTIKGIFNYFGFSISRNEKVKNNMELYEYTDSNGKFDYQKYKSIQT